MGEHEKGVLQKVKVIGNIAFAHDDYYFQKDRNSVFSNS